MILKEQDNLTRELPVFDDLNRLGRIYINDDGGMVQPHGRQHVQDST